MKVVTITDAKNNLSRHLELVRRGERIRILDRDVPVAELVPVEPVSEGEDDDWPALLAVLARRGLVSMPREHGPLPREILRRGPRSRKSVLEAVLEERRRSW